MTNQSNLEALHDIAMEFAEEANFAHKRGEAQTAKLFYQKAFNLEKTYALSFPTKPAYLLSRAVFLRSAAYLAFNTGHFIDALQLTLIGLSGNLLAFIAQQLKELKKKLQVKSASFAVTKVAIEAKITKSNKGLMLLEKISKAA